MATFGAVNVLAAAATLVIPSGPYSGEGAVQNLGPLDIYIGNDATVMIGGATGGIKVPPGVTETIRNPSGGIWAAVSADQVGDANTRWNVEPLSGVA